MNEEFAISLKTVLDQSSIADVKRQLSEFKDYAARQMNVSVAGASKAAARANRTMTKMNVQQVNLPFSEQDLAEANAALESWEKEIEHIQEMMKKTDATSAIERWTEQLAIATSYAEEIKQSIAEMNEQNAQAGSEFTGEAIESANAFEIIGEVTATIAPNIKRALKQILRMGAALLGVAGIYGSISKAMRSYLAQNEELQNKLNGAWYALGSLFAPLLEKLINWFVRLVSLADAFVRALGFAGVNMSKYGKAAKNAAKQLAGFDEINNLSDNHGSGPFNLDKVTDDELQKFKTIMTLVAGIAAGLAAWKIAKAFQEALKLTDEQCIGIGLAVAGATIFVLAFIDAWKNGINWDNLKLMLLGIVTAALGMYFAFGLVASASTLILGGVLLIVLALNEFLKTGKLTDKAATAMTAGFWLIGLALAALGSPIMAIVALIAGVLVPAIIQNWDTIKEKGQHFIEVTLPEFKNKVVNKILEIKDKVIAKAKDLIQGVKDKINALKQWWSNFTLPSFNIKTPHISWTTEPASGWIAKTLETLGLPSSIPKMHVEWYAKGGLFSGPNIIGVGEYSGASSNPEVVAPLDTLAAMFDNEETNDLLRRLIDVVDSKEFRTYISQNEIGKASVDYINKQSRIMGGSII